IVAGDRKIYIGGSTDSWEDDPSIGGGGGAVDSVNGQTGVVEIEADDVPYDNTASGLTATDVQAAIDELEVLVTGGGAAAYTIVTEASAFTADPGVNDGLTRYNRCGGDVTFNSSEPYT